MTHVITQPCIGTKSADCVDVCPVNCIHDGGDQYYIDPQECIDCGACVPVCPVDAIFAEAEVPKDLQAFIAKNASLAEKGPQETSKEPPKKDEAPAPEPAPAEGATGAASSASEERPESHEVLQEARRQSAPPVRQKPPPAVKAAQPQAKDPSTWDPTAILPMATHGETAGGSDAKPAPGPQSKAATQPPKGPAKTAAPSQQAPSAGDDDSAALEAAAQALEAAAAAVRAAASRARSKR